MLTDLGFLVEGKSGLDSYTAVGPTFNQFANEDAPCHQNRKIKASVIPLLFLFQLKTGLWRFSKQIVSLLWMDRKK